MKRGVVLISISILRERAIPPIIGEVVVTTWDQNNKN